MQKVTREINLVHEADSSVVDAIVDVSEQEVDIMFDEMFDEIRKRVPDECLNDTHDWEVPEINSNKTSIISKWEQYNKQNIRFNFLICIPFLHEQRTFLARDRQGRRENGT